MTFFVSKSHNYQVQINISWKICKFNHRQNQINVFLLKMQFTRKTKKRTKNKIKTIQNAQIQKKQSQKVTEKCTLSTKKQKIFLYCCKKRL